jgi:hypothetical protein
MIIYFNKNQELAFWGKICLYGIAVHMAIVRLLREIIIFFLKKSRLNKKSAR